MDGWKKCGSDTGKINKKYAHKNEQQRSIRTKTERNVCNISYVTHFSLFKKPLLLTPVLSI
jgi:hypothetical protein